MPSALVIQTAFAGDLILTLPLVRQLRRAGEVAEIDVLCLPETAPLLANQPDIRAVLAFDKKNRAESTVSLIRRLRRRQYDLCISPHRSHRSAMIARGTGAPTRVGFDTSGFPFLYTVRVPYRIDAHEADRNLDLLLPLTPDIDRTLAPDLYPSARDEEEAARALASLGGAPYICVAPGSVWATKRWTANGFRETVDALSRETGVVLVGGTDDRPLCGEILAPFRDRGAILSVAGALGWLASACVVRGARLLISNDSAPVHLASAMRTPVVEIYGATVPKFGFSPLGVPHRIVELEGLACRPCGIHGGDRCPIGTFECMESLQSQRVIAAARELLSAV